MSNFLKTNGIFVMEKSNELSHPTEMAAGKFLTPQGGLKIEPDRRCPSTLNLAKIILCGMACSRVYPRNSPLFEPTFLLLHLTLPLPEVKILPRGLRINQFLEA